jgi:hypothetical protein
VWALDLLCTSVGFGVPLGSVLWALGALVCVLCTPGSGLVWSGLVWSGLVWSGLVWSGLVWGVPYPYPSEPSLTLRDLLVGCWRWALDLLLWALDLLLLVCCCCWRWALDLLLLVCCCCWRWALDLLLLVGGLLLEVGSGPAASRDTPAVGSGPSRDTLFPLNLLLSPFIKFNIFFRGILGGSGP